MKDLTPTQKANELCLKYAAIGAGEVNSPDETAIESALIAATETLEELGKHAFTLNPNDFDRVIFWVQVKQELSKKIHQIEINKMEEITLTKDQLKHLLHCATGNVKDFVTDNDRFLDEWLEDNQNCLG